MSRLKIERKALPSSDPSSSLEVTENESLNDKPLTGEAFK